MAFDLFFKDYQTLKLGYFKQKGWKYCLMIDHNFQKNTNVDIKLLIIALHTTGMTPGLNKVK